MARNKLTERKIQSLDKVGIYSDGDGLYLRVRSHKSKSGGDRTISRSWVFIHRRGDKRSEQGLGGYGQGTAPVSLALAREKAEAIRERLARGDDLTTRKTFAEVMADVLAVKDASFRNEKHRAQWGMTLTKYAAPLHDKPIDDITIEDVMDCLKPIWSTTPETVDRTRQRIGAVFDHAKARGLFVGDNPARWRGGLKELLPPRKKLSRGHHEAVPYNDIANIMEELRASSSTSARAVEFVALTAVRSGEARNATWHEIDFEQALWAIPAERMKSARAHQVPLSDRALTILKAQRQRATNDLVFEGGKAGSPISDTAMTKSLRSAGAGNATLHGLRSTFRDWAGDCTSYPRDICEAALAHVIKDKAEAAYRRSTALAKRRQLMDDWAKFVEGKR